MTAATLVVSIAFVALGVIMRPGVALGLLVASMVFWPEYLRIKVGPAQMSAARLMAFAMFVRYALTGRLRMSEWRWLDGVVLGWWVWDVAANALAGSDPAQMNYVIGRGLDTWLMYFVGRVGIKNMTEFRRMFVPLAACAGWMLVAGAIESITTRGLYEKAFAHHGWLWFDKGQEFRLGFLRAKGSMAHPIYWGMAGVILTGLLGAMYEPMKSHRWTWLCAMCCALCATLSSLSSGPQLGLLLLSICAALSLAKGLIRPVILGIVGLCIFVETASNRHFYNLIDYLAINSGTAWYRTKLIEAAVSNWRDFAWIGVGVDWPHHWAAQIDGRGHVDVVNNYIIVALSGGLLGLGLYVCAGIGALRRAVVSMRHATREHRGVLYGLSATLVALGATSMSVGLYGPPLLLSYVLVGVLVSLSEPSAGLHPLEV